MKMSPSRTSKSKTTRKKKAMTAFSPKSRTKKTTSPASSIRALPRTKAKVTRAVPERRGMVRGHSSAGRAPAWHAGGQRFDPAWLHQFPPQPADLKFHQHKHAGIGGAKRLSPPRDSDLRQAKRAGDQVKNPKFP